jgi:ADP-heptose:LPS heptosyltransferase
MIELLLRRLLIRPGAIGDCVLSLPALERLRAEYTEVWTPSAVVPLIRFADRVHSIASTGLDLLGLPGIEPPPGLVERLRSFDSIVSWYGTTRENFRDAVTGLPFVFLPALPPPDEHVHAADYFLRAAGGEPPAIPRIHCPPAARRDSIVIHPFSGSARKNWPPDYYRELAARLHFPVEWCAGPEEEFAEAVRFENLYDLACWLSSARLYIGNDSGITHLAAAAGAPVLALFGPTDPAIWAPRGDVSALHGDLDQLSVEDVLNAAALRYE